ncbi:MAG: hypothetical protein PVG39_26075 [Desulfobacteraceae bacterium]|jgi:hypothetical protein
MSRSHRPFVLLRFFYSLSYPRGKAEQNFQHNLNTPDIDFNLLKDVIEGVEESLEQDDLELPLDKKAQLIVLLYEHFIKTNKKVSGETVTNYLKLVA